MKPSRLVAEHQRRNATIRDGWERFAGHRQQVMRLLTDACRTPQDRLCVLGAGNGNELDLPRLVERYAETHLVDLDAAALEFAVRQLPGNATDRVSLQGEVDVTQIFDQIGDATPDKPLGEPEIEELLVASRHRPPVEIGGPFDVVLSACLLSQLIDSSQLTLGPQHPRLVEVILEIRRRHLQLMVELLTRGGRGLLITDFVSTTTCPDLARIGPGQFAIVTHQLIQQRNFYTGANPFAIFRLFETDAHLAAATEQATLFPPWLWDIGPKQFAVAALRFVRR